MAAHRGVIVGAGNPSYKKGWGEEGLVILLHFIGELFIVFPLDLVLDPVVLHCCVEHYLGEAVTVPFLVGLDNALAIFVVVAESAEQPLDCTYLGPFLLNSAGLRFLLHPLAAARLADSTLSAFSCLSPSISSMNMSEMVKMSVLKSICGLLSILIT